MMRSWIWIIGIVTLVLTLSSIVTVLYGFGFQGKTLFQWMDIVIVPITVGIGVYLLEQWQRRREQVEQSRREQEREALERQREEEREKAAALQEYLHQMNEALTLDGLLHAQPDDEVARVARVRTLSILGILDPVRKGQVLRFLSEAALIASESPIVVLVGADLDGAYLRNQPIRDISLSGAHLREATLIAADLAGANLREAILIGADLSSARLSDTDLRGADLREANLRGASVRSANLSMANLRGADLRDANLSGVDLEAATLAEADLSHVDLRPTGLRMGETLKNTQQSRWEQSISGMDIEYKKDQHDYLKAELAYAELARANLRDADLRYANLYKANLEDADLTGANLKGATARRRAVVPNLLAEEPFDDEERATRDDLERWEAGKVMDTLPARWNRPLVPIEQLQQSRSLKGATLPRGEKYEAWLNDKENRGEPEENSSTS